MLAQSTFFKKYHILTAILLRTDDFFPSYSLWTGLTNSRKSAILDTGFASRFAFSPLPITPFAPAFLNNYPNVPQIIDCERLGTRQVNFLGKCRSHTICEFPDVKSPVTTVTGRCVTATYVIIFVRYDAIS